VSNLPCDGISYYEADHGTASAGFIQIAQKYGAQHVGKKKMKKTKVLYNLVVNQNHSKEEKFATIAHELGHLYCGHLGTPDPKWWPGRGNQPLNVREFEAESVAWLVCERAGVKNPSAEYLSGYLNKNAQIPQISLDNVLKAAGMIESMSKRTLTPRKEIVV